jgi:hypothetical protein
MKRWTRAGKTDRKISDTEAHDSFPGESAIAPAPPDYGIDFVNGGLPQQLRTWIESLSGLEKPSGVRVHANSDKPARLGALAYTQGDDIYLAAGRERQLANEAWHVVKQTQRRVQPNLQRMASPARRSAYICADFAATPSRQS